MKTPSQYHVDKVAWRYPGRPDLHDAVVFSAPLIHNVSKVHALYM